MDSDFDVDGLATYLHVTPQQIEKLAQRGKVPARKVAGKWVFNRSEIHLWLEQKLGASDEGLEEVEDVIAREQETRGEHVPEVSELLSPLAIAVPLAARTSGKVLRAMVDLSTDAGLLWEPDRMLDALTEREQLHPTAQDNGAALLHPRRPMPQSLGEDFLALGITSAGIPFGHRQLTDVFFFIGATSDWMHLQILARVSRLLTSTDVLTKLREVTSASEVLPIIQAAEAELS